jgi:serine/threonine protein kinase
MDSLLGKRFSRGQYEIIDKLGAGGMSTVFRARQNSVDRFVAIKIIRADLGEDLEFARRFQNEAKMMASLTHLHIMKVFDYGQENGMSYLVMELLQGGSLNKFIRAKHPLPLPMVGRLFGQMCDALAFAHGRGIIHRDLKSDNVMLDQAQQNAFLTDFGIAKLLGESTQLTQTGTTLGTPTYMAPELWQGGRADSRSDIYAMGVILYEMLTNNSPFLADTPFRVMYRHVNEMPTPAYQLRPDLPEAVVGVINRALAKNPDDRYQSPQDLGVAFQEAVGGASQVPGIISSNTAQATPAKLDLTAPYIKNTPTASAKQNTKQSVTKTMLTAEEDEPAQRKAGLLLPAMGVLAIVMLGAIVFLLSRRGGDALAAGQQGTQTATTVPTVVAIANTATHTNTATATLTITPTFTHTFTVTFTPTATATFTPSPTPLPTETHTPTIGLDTLIAQTLNPIFTQTAFALSGTQLAVEVEQTVQAGLNIEMTNIAATVEAQASLAAKTAQAMATRQQATLNAQNTATQRAFERTATASSLYATATLAAKNCPGTLPSRLQVGKRGRVNTAVPTPNRLRSTPSRGNNVIDQIPAGDTFKVLEGPTCDAQYGIAWWKVEWRNPSGKTVIGWTAESQGAAYYLDPIEG